MSEVSSLTAGTTPSLLPRLHLHGAAAELQRCRAKEILVEGPAGTGKSLACLRKCVLMCEAAPCRVLLCRASRVSMTESVLVTLERELLPEWHPARTGSDVTRAGRRSYSWPHGAELVVRGLDNTESVMSSEYDLIYVAEATEITIEDWERLLSRLRNNVLPFQQAIADCNPGPPAHWLNKRAGAGKMTRLLSRHVDNPSLTPEYLATLAGLTGHRRARLYEGRWVAAEGGVFPEFDTRKNVVPDFPIPPEWPKWLCVDPGYFHPCGVTWNTLAPNNTEYTIAEIKQAGMGLDALARALFEKNIPVGRSWCDPAGKQGRQEASGKSFIDLMAERGVRLTPWPFAAKEAHDTSVANHRQRIIDRRYKVFASCVETIAEHQSWSFKRVRGGEIPAGDDQYEDTNNDLLDGILGGERTNPEFPRQLPQLVPPRGKPEPVEGQEQVSI